MDRCKSSSGSVWLSSGSWSPVSGISNTYVNLVSGFCRFSPFLRFRETWTPGKGIYTTISKGSSQGLTYLGLTLQAGFLQNGHGFPSCHVSEFFTVFSVFFWFSGLRNRWKPNCLITDEPVTRATHGLSSMLFFVNVSYSDVILFRKPHISKMRRPRGGASWR